MLEKILNYKAFIFMVLVYNSTQLDAQIIYTDHFTEKLLASHLDYYKPLEQWYHVTPKTKDAFLKYDLVLINEAEDLEVRYILKPYEQDALDLFPHVDNSRIIHHIASNDPENDITAIILTKGQAIKRYNANWGVVHYFTPKISFSTKPYGALISIFSEGKATANAILLYEDEKFDVLSGFHQLRFRD